MFPPTLAILRRIALSLVNLAQAAVLGRTQGLLFTDSKFLNEVRLVRAQYFQVLVLLVMSAGELYAVTADE